MNATSSIVRLRLEIAGESIQLSHVGSVSVIARDFRRVAVGAAGRLIVEVNGQATIRKVEVTGIGIAGELVYRELPDPQHPADFAGDVG